MVRRIKVLQRICLFLTALILIQAVAIPARALSGQEEETAEATCIPEAAEQSLPETQPAAAEEEVPGETAIVPKATIQKELQSMELTKKEENTIDEVPLYYQTDYPDDLYASGTIATSGCSITALAMVATYLTDHEYLPDELADYFGGRAENNIERLELASETMQLPVESRLNFHETIAGLKEGKVAIALMEGDSIFTETQHFIVLTGYNEDGKIMVHDPYEPNYSNWQLKNAFVNGFKEGDILCGFSGGWLYDKSAMPEDPFIYKEEKVEVESRYPGVELTYEDKLLLAKMVWVEARGESADGQQAVAEVVLNRLVADNYPDTLRGVIYSEGQFRSTKFLDDAEPYQAQYEAIERALNGPYVLPMEVVFFATYPVNDNVWGKIGGHTFCYQWYYEEE